MRLPPGPLFVDDADDDDDDEGQEGETTQATGPQSEHIWAGHTRDTRSPLLLLHRGVAWAWRGDDERSMMRFLLCRWMDGGGVLEQKPWLTISTLALLAPRVSDRRSSSETSPAALLKPCLARLISYCPLCVYGCPGDDLIQTTGCTLSIGRNLDTLTCISWLVTITGPTGKETRTCCCFSRGREGGEQSVPPCTVATRSMTLFPVRTHDRPMAATRPNRQRKKTQTRQKRTKFAPSRTVGPGIWAGPKIQPNKPGLFERTTKRPANQGNQPNRRPNIID